ncbi:MAG TPA: PEP-CTERM sorting domain-containing protein [Caulobacteraceae bacterium]
MNKRTLLSAALGLSLAASAANATVWDFTFAGPGDTGSGTFTTAGGSSPFTITGITGTVDGNAITALLAPGVFAVNDNILYSPAPYLDLNGVSFVANGVDLNLFFLSGTVYGLENPTFTAIITSFTVTEAAGSPEPATWAIMLTGLFGVGAALRTRRRPAAA